MHMHWKGLKIASYNVVKSMKSDEMENKAENEKLKCFWNYLSQHISFM